jgi:hypothetical protein
MIFSWNLWFNEALVAYVAIKMIASGVANLRFQSDKKLRAVIFCALAYLVCVGVSFGHSYMHQETDKTVSQLKNPRMWADICSDWGKDSSKEDRLKFSRSIASTLFVREGNWGSYIDLNGKLTPYQPTDLDRQARTTFLKSIEQEENTSNLFFWLSIGWMLLPLVGVGLGFRSDNSRDHNCKVELTTTENKSIGTDILGTTPEACVAFIFFGYCIGWICLSFYRASHLLGAFLFLTLFALTLVIAIRRGVMSLGFKLYSWSAVIYAGFFITGFAAICYQVFVH